MKLSKTCETLYSFLMLSKDREQFKSHKAGLSEHLRRASVSYPFTSLPGVKQTQRESCQVVSSTPLSQKVINSKRLKGAARISVRVSFLDLPATVSGRKVAKSDQL